MDSMHTYQANKRVADQFLNQWSKVKKKTNVTFYFILPNWKEPLIRINEKSQKNQEIVIITNNLLTL